MNVQRNSFGHPGNLGLPSSRGTPRRRVHEAYDPTTMGTAQAADQTALDIAKQAAPYVKALVQEEDSTEDVETLRAQIRNHQRMRDGYFKGTIFYTLYDNKINVLRARLKAALAHQQRDREDRASKWEWANLGKAGVVTSIAVGAAIIVLVANLAGAASRSHRGAPAAGARRRTYRRGAA